MVYHKRTESPSHAEPKQNVRSHAEVEDSICNLLIWIWNTKDYLKKWLEEEGLDPRLIEDFINLNHSLSICGDLANRLKHAEAKRSRCGHFPKLGQVKLTMPSSSLRQLTFRQDEVEIDIGDPALVDFTIPVLTHAGDEIGEAFQLVAAALAALENLRDKTASSLLSKPG